MVKPTINASARPCSISPLEATQIIRQRTFPRSALTEVEGCSIPDELLYDVENDVWLMPLPRNLYRVGVAVPLLFLAGKLQRVKPREVGTIVRKGQALALLESIRYAGALTSPLDARIIRANMDVAERPETVAEDPYGEGWIVEIEAYIAPDSGLVTGEEASRRYTAKITRNNIMCLKVLPDHRITALAESCEMILTKIGDFHFKFVAPGETLHVVTQDPATEVDLIKWAQDMKQELVDIRKTGKLLHVVYRRVG